MAGIYIIFILITLLSALVQQGLNSKFNKYSKVMLPGRLTGKEVAEKMLRENGVSGVKVESVKGKLTDHYNPVTKIVNLSEPVYDNMSVAAAAVAAHECGHAVQHATSYRFLTLRSKLVPLVNFASQWMQWVLLAGIILLQVFPQLLLAGIALFSLTTLFSLVTLPVEINASRRAIQWLDQAGITDAQTRPQAESALRWAAYTYVIAAVGSLATLLYYVMIFMNGRRR